MLTVLFYYSFSDKFTVTPTFKQVTKTRIHGLFAKF